MRALLLLIPLTHPSSDQDAISSIVKDVPLAAKMLEKHPRSVVLSSSAMTYILCVCVCGHASVHRVGASCAGRPACHHHHHYTRLNLSVRVASCGASRRAALEEAAAEALGFADRARRHKYVRPAYDAMMGTIHSRSASQSASITRACLPPYVHERPSARRSIIRDTPTRPCDARFCALRYAPLKACLSVRVRASYACTCPSLAVRVQGGSVQGHGRHGGQGAGARRHGAAAGEGGGTA
jgi:hypothetical protein